MNIRLSPAESSLQKWALGDQENIDLSVQDDAAVQLARRDRMSETFVAFLTRWVPEGRMDSVLFERFAQAWDIVEHEKFAAHMQSEVGVPEDLREPASGE